MKLEFVFQLFYYIFIIDIELLAIDYLKLIMYLVSVEKYRYPKKYRYCQYRSPISSGFGYILNAHAVVS